MNLTEFILLKAIFNKALHDAVLVKDKTMINHLLATNYRKEYENGFFVYTDIDLEFLYTEHLKNLNENLDWAL